MADEAETILSDAATLCGIAAFICPFFGVGAIALEAISYVGKAAGFLADVEPSVSAAIDAVRPHVAAGTLTPAHVTQFVADVKTIEARRQDGRSGGYSPG